MNRFKSTHKSTCASHGAMKLPFNFNNGEANQNLSRKHMDRTTSVVGGAPATRREAVRKGVEGHKRFGGSSGRGFGCGSGFRPSILSNILYIYPMSCTT